jgi:hypothetical protein
MTPLAVGRVQVSAVVERAGPTRPTWLLPDAVPEAVERHREWLAPHFLDDKGRFLQSPGLIALVDTCVGNDKDRGGRRPFHMMLGTHFHHPTAGRIVRHGPSWRFVVAPGADRS